MAAIKMLVFFCLTTVVFAFSNEYVTEMAHDLKRKTNAELTNQMAAFQRTSVLYMAYASYFDRGNVNLPGFRKFFLAASDRSLKDAQKINNYINLRGGHHQFPIIKLHAACKSMKTSSAEVAGKFPNYHPRSETTTTTEIEEQEICHILQSSQRKSDKKAIYGLKTPKSSDTDWKKGLLALSDALMLERDLQRQLIDLAAKAGSRRKGDRHLRYTVENTFLAPQAKHVKRLADVITKLRKYTKEEYPLGEYVMDLEMRG